MKDKLSLLDVFVIVSIIVTAILVVMVLWQMKPAQQMQTEYHSLQREMVKQIDGITKYLEVIEKRYQQMLDAQIEADKTWNKMMNRED